MAIQVCNCVHFAHSIHIHLLVLESKLFGSLAGLQVDLGHCCSLFHPCIIASLCVCGTPDTEAHFRLQAAMVWPSCTSLELIVTCWLVCDGGPTLQQAEAPEAAGAPAWKSLIAPGKVEFWQKAVAVYHFCRATPVNEFITMVCSDNPTRWKSDPRRRECYNSLPSTLAKISLVKEGMPLADLFQRLSVESGCQGSAAPSTRLAQHPAHHPQLCGRAQQLFDMATGEPDDKERTKWQEGAPECVFHCSAEVVLCSTEHCVIMSCMRVKCRWTKQLIRDGRLDNKQAGRPPCRLHESRHPVLAQLREALLEGFSDDKGRVYPFPNLPWAYKHSSTVSELVSDLGISTPEYAWVLLKKMYPDLTLHRASLKHPREELQAQCTAKCVLGQLPLPLGTNLSQFKHGGEKIGSLPQVRYWASRKPRFRYRPDILWHQIYMDGLTMQPERSAKALRSIGVKGQPPAPSPCKLANVKVGILSVRAQLQATQ